MLETALPPARMKRLTDSYNNSEDGQGGFLVREGEIYKSTPEEMALIFGMQILENGKQDLLETRTVCPRNHDLCKKYFGGAKAREISNVQVKEAILRAMENEVEELVRLLVLYLCCTIFFTKTGGSKMPCRYLVLIESVDVINSISWPHLIYANMMDGIKKSNGDYTKISGCTFYLLYWYAEGSNKLIQTRDGHKTSFPIFARWNTKTISTTIQTFNSSSFRDIKPNFGSQVENELENTLVTKVYVVSRVENLNKKIIELQAEVSNQRQKQHVVKVKLCEIQKWLTEDPEKIEVVKNILEDLLKQDKEHPLRKQEQNDSDPEREQETTSTSGLNNAHYPNLGQPTQRNNETHQQQEDTQDDTNLQQENNQEEKQNSESNCTKDANFRKPTQLSKEKNLPLENKQKEEEEEKKSQDLLTKELGGAKEKEEKELKNREMHERLKKEEKREREDLLAKELAIERRRKRRNRRIVR